MNMLIIHVVIIFVLVKPYYSTDQFGIKRNGTIREALFRKVTTDRALDVTPITILTNCNLPCCAKRCIRETLCDAFNRQSTNCELLNVDRNTKSDSQVFVDRTGWLFYDTGLNIRHPNWRYKNLNNVLLESNSCANCPYIASPEEPGNGKCDCFNGEGPIIVGTSGMCWRPENGCESINGTNVTLTACVPGDESHNFKFNGETGQLVHVCSHKRVCAATLGYGTPIIVSNSQCVIAEDKRRWLLTDEGHLNYGDHCIHTKARGYGEGITMSIWQTCFGGNFLSHKFAKKVEGRVKVKLWKNVPAYSSLSSKSTYPDNPDFEGWFHQLDTPNFGSGLDQIGRQMKTYFISPETGPHVFYVSVDNAAIIYFGTSESSKQQIFNKITYTGRYVYSQQTAPQQIQKDTKYYMEVIMYSYGGNDYVTVGVIFPSGSRSFPITDRYLIAPIG